MAIPILRIKDNNGNISTVPAIKGEPGAAGQSAYQAAVASGYTGTEAVFNAALIDAPNKANKVVNAVGGNFAGLDSNGNLTDSGKKTADFVTAAHTNTQATATVLGHVQTYNGVDSSSTTLVATANAVKVAYDKAAAGTTNIPVASTTVLGGVKQGAGVTIDNTGVISVNFQNKSVTPTASGFEVTPDSGKVLRKVTVAGNSNLIPGNIKSGVSVFGVTGSMVAAASGSTSPDYQGKLYVECGFRPAWFYLYHHEVGTSYIILYDSRGDGGIKFIKGTNVDPAYTEGSASSYGVDVTNFWAYFSGITSIQGTYYWAAGQ